ncbi:hypothetical protein FGF82_24485, partial [Salmonella sp. gx-f9]|nr:hypothetical protein [Salmonella sp. gx-f9]
SFMFSIGPCTICRSHLISSLCKAGKIDEAKNISTII